MPLYEYTCICGRDVHERLIACPCQADTQRCEHCGHQLIRRPSASAFKVEGFSAKNGYASGGK